MWTTYTYKHTYTHTLNSTDCFLKQCLGSFRTILLNFSAGIFNHKGITKFSHQCYVARSGIQLVFICKIFNIILGN